MDIAEIIFLVIKTFAIFFFLLNMGGAMTFIERKQSALMQHRIGGNRAALPFINERWPFLRHIKTAFGLWHNLADAVKMALKENFKPRYTDRLIYNLALWFAVVPSFLAFAVVPISGPIMPGHLFDFELMRNLFPGFVAFMAEQFGDKSYSFAIANLDIGVLFIFAMGGVSVFATVLAGWSSNNKFGLLGGVRAASQMVSYEISMGLSVMGLILIAGSVAIEDIIQYQSQMIFGFIPMWGIILQPIGFLLFLTASIAENKRIPFDLPEAESELVAGYFTEYSAMKMMLFMLAEFTEIFIIGAIITTLFLGGYSVPFLEAEGFKTPFGDLPLPQIAVFLLQHIAFVIKTFIIVWIQFLIRWTLPRFRHDQLMRLGWKNMLPLAIANLVVTIVVVVLIR